MSWLAVDDGFCEHQKVVGLSNQAFRLHVAAMCLCARLLTDGKLTEQHLRKVAADLPFNPARYTDELVAAKLWITASGGWKIKDYLDYNPSSEQVKERRRKAAERQAKWKRSNAVSNAVTNSAPSPPQPLIKPEYTNISTEEGVNGTSEVDPDALAKIADLTERIGRVI